mmetsp:Transcript_56723/g.151473  ORF Transcript_56723/g.151473 Transcript_56723/m.151473 type:complete len:204 (-) Transcript_56723:451-1062(-)
MQGCPMELAPHPLSGLLPCHAERGHHCGVLGQEGPETTVEHHLAPPQVQIIITVTKGILQFLRGHVQGTEDEDKDEGEDGRPDSVRGPTAKHVWRQGHEEGQQDPCRRCVRERRRDHDQADRVVVRVHSGAKLLKDRGQQRRRNVQDPILDAIHNHLLEPVFHESGTVSARDEGRQRVSIERCYVQQLKLESALRSREAKCVR